MYVFIILKNKSFSRFRGMQGMLVPATKTNVFVLVRKISSFKVVRYAIGQESDEIHQL
jgi:hypothetical protein